MNPDLKILVVDDFSMMRKVVHNILKSIGYTNVLEEEDGEKAFATLQLDSEIGLVITDWNMPNMNGLELLKKIRADERMKDLPVMMITAEALHENIVAAVKCGVNNFLVKPFDADTMKEKIEKIFEN